MRILLFSLLSICSWHLSKGQNQEALNKQVTESLKKATVYFESRGTDIPARDVVIVLFMLQEHFQYPMSLPPLEVFKSIYPDLNHFNILLYDKYFENRKIPSMGDSKAIDSLQKSINTIDGLNFWSMYCDRYALPDTIIKVLKRNIYKGGYFMTHTGLQLGNMLRLKCIKEGPAVSELKTLLTKELVRTIADPTDDMSNDEIYESLVMLYYIGADTQVSNDFIQKILKDQLPDGGWSYEREGIVSHIHPTVLALWALLEYRSRHN